MRRLFARLPGRLFLVGMLLGSALMTWVSLPYFDFETLPAFMLEKVPLRFERLWLAALRIHVASALLALPLCLVLMTRFLQRRPAWHRWLGRVTGVLLLGPLVPSGVVLAFDAKGGALGTLGFLVSGAIVAGCTVLGVAAARRRDLAAHARMMRHVVAQMSVAVTSRVLIVLLDVAGMEPGAAYVVALWGPVLVSAVVAELVSARSPVRVSKLLHLERIRRENFSFPRLVRVRAVRPVARLGR
jgi:uncharacterized membrane protein